MSGLLAPIHPGEILAEEFLAPFGITPHQLAALIDVPPDRVDEIVHGKRGITSDTALRLAQVFGTSEQFWTTLQASYEEDQHGRQL